MRKKVITVNDRMQHGYQYELTEPEGKNFAPGFSPDLTPKQLLELGVFGGVYIRDCVKEFPKDWFAKAEFQRKDSYVHDPALNFFGMNASQPLSVWRAKKWIFEEHDPRGWFQWYCRYYMGRRVLDMDEVQIRRWKAIRRHIAQVKKNCRAGDKTCRPKQRQAILHWAYDSRKI